MHLHQNALAAPPEDCEVIWLHCDEYNVETWYFRPRTAFTDKPFPVLIMAHGNGRIMDFWAKRIRALPQMGIGVLMVEYPGYGRSGGNPSYKTITETFTKAYDMLISLPGVDTQKIIAFGFSMGGAAACTLAEHRPVRAVILLSTFASLYDMVNHYWLPSFLVLDPFDNAKVLQHYEGPSLVLHAPDDTIIPFHQAQKLAGTSNRVRLIVLKGGHDNQVKDWPLFWETFIAEFLMENHIITIR
ncbi:MAG: alpha/beta fold hydrolase [Spirochaetales bacterium]|nr:alpha/beta fold hydrolase [Spirochaetales bacterium]